MASNKANNYYYDAKCNSPNSFSSSSSSRSCLCSPTSHPGSFRCSLHRRRPDPSPNQPVLSGRVVVDMVPPRPKLLMMKVLLKNHVLKPSSSANDCQRSMNFKPKPSRFRNSNCAGNEGCNNDNNRTRMIVS